LAYNRGTLSDSSDRFGLVGTIVADKYAVEKVVGEGGFGIVFRAMHRIWDEPVALKCFTALANAPVELRDELLDQFVQEGKLLTALSSRTTGIVQARDIGTLTTPGGAWLPYMVLEWLDGKTLEDYLGHADGRPLGTPRGALEVFQLMDGVARALALAHARGVAHRDIKPANFFVLGAELVPGVVIKVLDFGIAKVMQAQPQAALKATGTQISSFTPSYGAPEQFDRGFGATGPWTDVYQMALVMLEVMRGGLPALAGDSFMQLAFASQHPDRRPTPRTFGIEVSDAVEAVYRRAVALRVDERFANMAEFWMALAAAHGFRDYAPLPTGDGLTSTVSPMTGGAPRTAPPVTVLPGVPSSGAPSHTAFPPDTIAAPRTTANTGRAPPTVSSAGPRVKRPASGGKVAAFVVGGAVLAAGLAFGVVQALKPRPPVSEPVEPESAAAPTKAAPVVTPPVAGAPCPEGMVLLTGGHFFMGTDVGKSALAMARPAHKVEVGRFCMDIHEVTTEDYVKCSDKGECKRAFPESFWPQGSMKKSEWEKARAAFSPLCNFGAEDRGRHPINCVMWAQASEYCKVMGKRLPTEMEFEFAARGSDGRRYPWGDTPPSERHLNGCGKECVDWRAEQGLPAVEPLFPGSDAYVGTAPIGSFPEGRTQAGLFDITGNVFEWTADPFQAYPQPGMETPAPAPTNNRVIRGGAFNSSEPEHSDPALRLPYDADAYTHGIGFRCAADPA
jgi:formylglycine-generating enzyme required for sulfatase activity